MNNTKEKGSLSKLLSEAILQLCRVGLGLHGNFNIDGIICIENNDKDDPEIVVKIHEKIGKGFLDPTSRHNNNEQVPISSVNLTNVITQPIVSLSSHIHNVGGKTQHYPSQVTTSVPSTSYPTAPSKFMPVITDSASTSAAKRNDIDFSYLNDSDCEILDDSTHKQLFGDLGTIADGDLGGLIDVDFGDISIKPDPAKNKKAVTPSILSDPDSKAIDSGSDEELKIEKLTAGRSRKPNRSRPAYRDVHGESVQVLSSEEYTRILKSEKLKRSRDKSPDFFPGAKRVPSQRHVPAAVGSASAGTQGFGAGRQAAFSSSTPMVGFSAVPRQIASIHDTSIASISTLPSNSGVAMSYGNGFNVATGSANMVMPMLSSVNNTTMTTKIIGTGRDIADVHVDKKPVVITRPIPTQPNLESSGQFRLNRSEKKFLSSLPTTENDFNVNVNVPKVIKSDSSSTPLPNVYIDTALASTSVSHGTVKTSQVQENREVAKPQFDKSLVCLEDVNTATQSEPHKCPFCTRVYDTFKLLDLHMYQMHKGNFMCPLCGKLFKQRSTRNRHIVAVHSQVKNFACSMCNATFTRVDSVKKHFLTQHPDIHVPKFPYSYKRGETINNPEPPALELKQDMADTDVVYIQEHLMRSIPGESDMVNILGTRHKVIPDMAGSSASQAGVEMDSVFESDMNETEAAVEVIMLESDEQNLDSSAQEPESSIKEVVGAQEEIQVELVDVGMSATPSDMDMNVSKTSAGCLDNTSSVSSNSNNAADLEGDYGTPTMLVSKSEVSTISSNMASSQVVSNIENTVSASFSSKPEVTFASAGTTSSLLPSALVSRLKHSDMRQFVTVIQAKHKDKIKIDFKDTIMHSSYTAHAAVSPHVLSETLETPQVSSVITDSQQSNETTQTGPQTQPLVNDVAAMQETQPNDLGVNIKFAIPYSKVSPTIKSTEVGTVGIEKTTQGQLKLNESDPAIAVDSNKQRKETEKQSDVCDIQTNTERTDNPASEISLENSNQAFSIETETDSSPSEQTNNVQHAANVINDNETEPVYYQNILVPTHTVEFVEPGTSLDSLSNHSTSLENTNLASAISSGTVPPPSYTVVQNTESIRDNIDNATMTETSTTVAASATNEDERMARKKDSTTPEGIASRTGKSSGDDLLVAAASEMDMIAANKTGEASGDLMTVRSTELESQTGERVDQKVMSAIEISDEEMETSD